MQDIPFQVINNIRHYVEKKSPDIWVRRDQQETAEAEFNRMKLKGEIISATLRPDWSCNGSLNYLMEYPA